MNLLNNFGPLLAALSFPLTYANTEFRAGDASSSNSENINVKPYLAAVFHGNQYACIGSLITMDYVVTAYNCQDTRKKITVKAGSNGEVRNSDPRNPRKGMDRLHIGIIKVYPAFDSDSTETIKLCNTDLKGVGQMQVVSDWNSQIEFCESISQANHICLIGDERAIKPVISGRGSTIKVDAGAPGVVDGTLCAVAASDFYSSSRTYADLSKGSGAQSFIIEKTGYSE